MSWYRNLRMMWKIVLPVGLMLLMTLSLLAWQIQSKSSSIIESIALRELAALAGEHGNAAKSLFEVPLDETQALANSLEPSLEGGVSVSRELLIQMITGLEQGSEAFMAAGSAWEPDAFDGKDAEYAGKPGHDKNGRFIPYSVGGKIEPLQDLETSDYYAEPKKRNKSYLTKPYWYEAAGKKVLMSTASAAVQSHGKFKGIILIDLSLEGIAQEVKGLKIYTSGWGAMLSQDGTIVADKSPDLIGKNMVDTGRVGKVAELKRAMLDGKPFMDRHEIDGATSFFYYHPINFGLTGQTWYFVVSAPIAEVLAEVVNITFLTIGISAAVLVLSMLLIFVVVRANVKPLGILARVAKEIAGGNLKVAINDEGFGGEVRELSTALKEMIASLLEQISKAEALSADAQDQTLKAEAAMREAEIARQNAELAKRDGMLAAANQLEGVVHIISTASEELSAQIEQSERGSSEQASRVGETATAMEEMNSTVLEVARNASAASDVSAQTRAKAEEGARVVHDAVSGIQNVQTVSLSLKEDMTKLAEQAQAISNIMGVISDIADQTNLLALNAAIEAARAGEAGRGFAVVADEVRKLAEKTMTSTTDVGNAIKSIQQSVKQSIGQVERAADLIDIATKQSNKSGEALSEIVAMVDGTADQVRAIATASEQQSSTSEEINRSIGHINDIAEHTAQAMREAAKAVSDLASQTQTLSRLIEEMKRG